MYCRALIWEGTLRIVLIILDVTRQRSVAALFLPPDCCWLTVYTAVRWRRVDDEGRSGPSSNFIPAGWMDDVDRDPKERGHHYIKLYRSKEAFIPGEIDPMIARPSDHSRYIYICDMDPVKSASYSTPNWFFYIYVHLWIYYIYIKYLYLLYIPCQRAVQHHHHF